MFIITKQIKNCTIDNCAFWTVYRFVYFYVSFADTTIDSWYKRVLILSEHLSMYLQGTS